MLNITDYLETNPDVGKVLYYPGSGTDFEMMKIFIESSTINEVYYADYMDNVNIDQALGALGGEWDVINESVLIPLNFHKKSWADFWYDNVVSTKFSGPHHAHGIRITLQKNKTGKIVTFYYLKTEGIGTYKVLLENEIRPDVIILQDHGFGCQWAGASFGYNGDVQTSLYGTSKAFHHFPKYLFVGVNTSVWQGYYMLTEFEGSYGSAGHKRGLFTLEAAQFFEGVVLPMSDRPDEDTKSSMRVRFDLTDEELSASVYYGAAGIDIQPLLRFGDMAKDYIYVNAGLGCTDFLRGVDHGVRMLRERHPGLLRLVEVAEIEPKPSPYIVEYPDFMNPGQREKYARTFGIYARDAGSCSRLLTFKLQVGSETKTLRIWHFNGEAIATYDMIFLRRSLAPMVLITIQAGLLERPAYIMNAMLASSLVRPKVWVRGVWSDSEIEHFWDRDVFDPIGIYDVKIWEARGWDAQFGCNIPGTTDLAQPYRNVAGYGESIVWNNIAPSGHHTLMTGRDLHVTKRNEPHNPHVHRGYTREVSAAVAEALAPHVGCNAYFQLDKKRDCEYRYAVPHHPVGPYTTWSRAHEHFECFEMYADEFVRNFTPIRNVPLHIDLFYMWPLEYRRHF
jgi:hypothetical protein